MSLESHFRKQMVLMLVQKHIFCPFSADVLDVDTCVVVLDSDGDPCRVMSPRAYTAIVKVANDKGVDPLGEGYTFDPATIPS